MKGIKKTLMAGLLAFAGVEGARAEVSSWGYGIHVSGGTSSAIGYDNDAKIGGKKAEGSFFSDMAYGANFYGECPITGYVGIGGELGWIRQGASLEPESGKEASETSNSTDSSVSMASHNIAAGLNLCIYPLGREEGEGILKVKLGAVAYVPLHTTYKKGSTDLTLTSEQKTKEASFDVAALGSVGYEFPMGLVVEAGYRYGIMNKFKADQQILTAGNAGIEGLKEVHIHNAMLSLGYNFASLLSE